MDVFSYIISLGASVMMPIIFTVIGLCIGMKFGQALKSGLYVGVGFVGLGVVTALLTTNFNDPLKAICDLYHLQLNVFDMGWPAAASVAYNTAVGALIIPICLGINVLMLLTKTTSTLNIDLWNYWHFAFIGAVAYFVMGESLAWGYFAAIVCYIITLVLADITAPKFQKYYDLEPRSSKSTMISTASAFRSRSAKALCRLQSSLISCSTRFRDSHVSTSTRKDSSVSSVSSASLCSSVSSSASSSEWLLIST